MEAAITPKERAELADRIGVHEQYLYQCLTGRRNMEPALAMQSEQKSNGQLRRWMLHDEWAAIWPDLVKEKGAPHPLARKERKAAMNTREA